MKYRYKLTVRINGTDENRRHKFDLTQNPFPQIAKAQFDRGEMALASLDGDPVRSEQDIRDRLKGVCSEELIQLCCQKWVFGEHVAFDIYFND